MTKFNLKRLRELAKNSIPVLGICSTFVGIAFFYGQMLSPNTSHELQHLMIVSNNYMP
ncbi:hypothetical protein Bealeia1_00708 [Candidatus Bealeia paramacronuclearis]|uniref:Uncharacterized protein n=1 Tax=Candidatus Bealeia paramacronuclearis TaxID=1921001 RepID=A0ABZ2C221_9PROT|nr:hypothetical protein [Candidatus Bealeia paramacronuclearis]